MKSLALIFLSLFFISCASQKDQQDIQKKVSDESVSDGRTLNENLNEVVRNSKTLNEKQKQELEKILSEIKIKNKALMEDSFKQKAVLIKELLNKNINQRQVKLLKKNIRKLESKRLKNTLDTIDRISLVVAGDPEGQKYIEHMMYMDRSFR